MDLSKLGFGKILPLSDAHTNKCCQINRLTVKIFYSVFVLQKVRHSLPLSSLFSSFQQLGKSNYVHFKFRQWLDSNCRPCMVLETWRNQTYIFYLLDENKWKERPEFAHFLSAIKHKEQFIITSITFIAN